MGSLRPASSAAAAREKLVTSTESGPKRSTALRIWRARFVVSQGGIQGSRVFVRVEALDSQDRVLEEAHQTKVLDVTNHYKKAFTSIPMRPGTTHVRVTLKLMPKKGATRCKVVADTANLTIIRAS